MCTPSLGQRRPQLLAPARCQRRHHRRRPCTRGGELLLGVQAVRADVLDAGPILLQQRRDAHHEELVEVRGDDGEELDALEQGMRRVERLVQDALIELEPAELAVDVERGMLEVCRVELRPVGAHRRAAGCGAWRLVREAGVPSVGDVAFMRSRVRGSSPMIAKPARRVLARLRAPRKHRSGAGQCPDPAGLNTTTWR